MIKRKRVCRVCNKQGLKQIWDLGMTPLANSYLRLSEIDRPEMFFPLQLTQCENCGNIQLAHVVDPKAMFSRYLYESSTSPVFRQHFEDFAVKMGKKRFVVDIGGNDGILLRPFKALKSKVLNVDPAKNIRAEGISTLHEFFTVETAKYILNKYGKADLVTATNVFAHIDNLDEVVEGVKTILADDGLFVVEVTDVEKMLEMGSFDLIYHEHVNYWSESAFRTFFELRGMEVVEVEKIPVHGGSLRVYARIYQQS